MFGVPEGDHVVFVGRSDADSLGGARPHISQVFDASSVVPGSTNHRDPEIDKGLGYPVQCYARDTCGDGQIDD